MDPIVADVNEVCSMDTRYYRFANKVVRVRPTWAPYSALTYSVWMELKLLLQLCVVTVQTTAQPVSVPRQSWTTPKKHTQEGRPAR